MRTNALIKLLTFFLTLSFGQIQAQTGKSLLEIRHLAKNSISTNGDVVFASTSGQIFEADPRHYESSVLRTSDAPIGIVAMCDETYDNSILAVTAEGKIYKATTSDDWTSWNYRGSLPGGENIVDLAKQNTSSTGDWIFVSSDGKIWEADPRRLYDPKLRTSSGPSDLVAVCFESYDNSVLAVTSDGKIYKGDPLSDWATWNQVGSLSSASSIVDMAKQNISSTGDWVFVSSEGKVWEADPRHLYSGVLRTSNAKTGIASVIFDSFDNSMIAVTTEGEIYKAVTDNDWTIWSFIGQLTDSKLLTVSNSQIEVEANANHTIINITSNVEWGFSETEDWFTAVKTDASTLTINYEQNFSTEERSDEITISGEGVVAITITITQSGDDPRLVVPNTTKNVSADPGQVVFDIDSNIDWIFSETDDWFTSVKTDASTLIINYEQNFSTEERSGEITISGEGVVTVTITITQSGDDPRLVVPNTTKNVSADPGQVVFDIDSNIDWIFSETEDWFTVVKTDASTLTINYEQNTSTEERSAEITISGEGVVSITISITQSGDDPRLVISPVVYSVTFEAGQVVFHVDSNIDWIFSETEEWFSAVKTDASTLTINYEQNTSTEERSGEIVRSHENVPPVTVVLTQANAETELDISPDTTWVSADAGQVEFHVESNIDWDFVETVDWFTVEKTDAYTLTVSYEQNSSVKERSGIIIVSDFRLASVIVSLIQAGETPRLEVVRTSETVSAKEGKLVIDVDSNIDWSFSEAENWFSAEKTNDSTLTMNYVQNTMTEERSGEILLFGDRVTSVIVSVTQVGETPRLEVIHLTETVSAEEGQLVLDVDSNIDWNFSETEGWFSAEKTNDSTLTIDYAQNNSVVERTGKVTLTGNKGTSVSVTLTQAGESPRLEVQMDSIFVGSVFGTTNIEIQSNLDWRFLTLDSWLSCAKIEMNALQITHSENHGNARIGEIQLFAEHVDTIIVKLYQEGSTGTFYENISDQLDITIYPNPTTEKIFLRSTADNTYETYIKIYAITGQILYSKTINGLYSSGVVEIDMSNFITGQYILEIKNINSHLSRKIVKE